MKIDSIRKFALSLEAVTEEPHHHFSSFRVRGKIFVTIPPGEELLHVFVDEQAREVALALYSEFIEKLLWGGKVVGLRVSLKEAKAGVVKSLVADAYNTRVGKDAGPKNKPQKTSHARIARIS
jgi:YjbR